MARASQGTGGVCGSMKPCAASVVVKKADSEAGAEGSWPLRSLRKMLFMARGERLGGWRSAREVVRYLGLGAGFRGADQVAPHQIGQVLRSEERRVGKECRSRWSPYH